MTNFSAELERLCSRLVKLVQAALESEALPRWQAQAEAERFCAAVTAAVAGNDAPLAAVVENWPAVPPASIDHSGGLPLTHRLRRLRQGISAELAQALPPADALSAVLALEKLLGEIELETARRESAARLKEALAQLRQVREEIIRLNKSKSDFISVAAHELKTPLTLVEAYATFLGMEYPAEQYGRIHELLKGLENGTRRLTEIIEAMIDISLIDNGLLALHYQPVQLTRLVETARCNLEDVLARRKLRLEVNMADESGNQTYGDEERLFQVMMILLENAVKFTPDGGLISVGIGQRGEYAALSVADTGIGIAPENRERIFEKFGAPGDVALHSTGKTKFKGRGVGLGLAIARGIIDAHGGRIWAESPGLDEQTCP